MTHNRECPKCGKIIPWTKGKELRVSILGKVVVSHEMHLICPEHGEFEPRVNTKLARIGLLKED